MEETLKILKKARLDPEDTAEKGRMAPTADLASRIRETQGEIVRISKISNNLQRALRAAASLTMGLTDVLRTRADEAGGRSSDVDVNELRELVASLQNEQARAKTKVANLRSEMEDARTKADNQPKNKNDKEKPTRLHP